MSCSYPGPKAATYISDNLKSTTPQNYLTDVSNQRVLPVSVHD